MCNHLTYILLCAMLHQTAHSAVFVPASKSDTTNNVDKTHPLIANLTLVNVNQTGKFARSPTSKELYNDGGMHSADTVTSRDPGSINTAMLANSGTAAAMEEMATSNVPGDVNTTVPADSERPAVWEEIRRVCGYYRMCSEERSYSGYSLMPTCCLRCSCHASCTLSNNCCPDLQLDTSQPDTPGACTTLYNILMDAQEEEAHKASDDTEINDTRSESTVERHHLATAITTQAARSTVTAQLLNHVKQTHTEATWPRQNSVTESSVTTTAPITDNTAGVVPNNGATATDNREGFVPDTLPVSGTNPALLSVPRDTGKRHRQQQTDTSKPALRNNLKVNDVEAVNATNNTQNNLYIKDSAEPDAQQKNVAKTTTVDMESSNTQVTNKLYAKYVVVSSCPSEFKKSATVQKCLRKTSAFTRDLIPVMDISNVKIYRNAYCAQCNGIINYIPMDIMTTCTELYLLDSIPVYFKDFRRVTQDCIAYVDPTTYIQTANQVCNAVLNDDTVISQCNVTGQWDSYDSYTQTMCVKGEHMATYRHRQAGSAASYKNIYCYMCNSRSGMGRKDTCNDGNYIKQKSSDGVSDMSDGFRAYLSVTIPEKLDRLMLPQGLERPTTTPYLTQNNCMFGYIPDMYAVKCRRFVCPIDQTPIYSICLKKNDQARGLVLAGRVRVQLQESPVYIGRENWHAIITAIQQRLSDYLQVTQSGCQYFTGDIYVPTQNDHLPSFSMMLKIRNTKDCSVETALAMYQKIATEKVVLESEKVEGRFIPGFSFQMTYKNLVSNNSIFKVAQDSKLLGNNEVVLNASFHCPRVVLTVSEYQNLVDHGKLEQVDNYILQQQYTLDTGWVEICLDHYLNHWLMSSKPPSVVAAPPKSTLEVTLSAIATVVSMLSITVVIITFCIFSELRFIPGKLAMILCINLLLAQGFYAFGLDTGVDNVWCKLIGMCIHFFWLASIFSMNSILFLMLKSFHKPLHVENSIIIHSRSAIEILKYIIHCYLIPLLCVLFNALSSTLHITDEFGYGGNLCYIHTANMRIFTFAVPIGMVMCLNCILFAMIMYNLSNYMKTANKKVPVKQIYIFFKLITMTGLYWFFGFLYELTEVRLFAYLFIVLNAGQGFFLMWTFLHNSHVCGLYKNAITKYIKKFRKDTSGSYSLS